MRDCATLQFLRWWTDWNVPESFCLYSQVNSHPLLCIQDHPPHEQKHSWRLGGWSRKWTPLRCRCPGSILHIFGLIPVAQKLMQSLLQFLLGTIEKSPDLYLDELQEMLVESCGVNVSCATVWRTLRKACFMMKKVSGHSVPHNLNTMHILMYSWMTHVAVERSVQAWFEYLAQIGTYKAEQLVFVDESSIDQRTTYRGHAWSVRGTKAQCKAFFIHGWWQVNHLFILVVLTIVKIFGSPHPVTSRWVLALQCSWGFLLHGIFHNIYHRTSWQHATISCPKLCYHDGQLLNSQAPWHSGTH